MERKERYIRNAETFSWDEMERIQKKSICVVGCGGLGGYVCQTLARFGVGKITTIDGDVFNESNLNRQAFANTKTLGMNKALAAREALTLINPDVAVMAHPVMLSSENAAELLQGHDLAIDCLDSIPSRFLLAKQCSDQGIPMVHGAIAGFYGQIANIFPGDDLLDLIYPNKGETISGLEKKLGNPAFTPQLVSAIQCSEALKLLAGRQNILRHSMLHIDLLNNSYETIALLHISTG